MITTTSALGDTRPLAVTVKPTPPGAGEPTTFSAQIRGFLPGRGVHRAVYRDQSNEIMVVIDIEVVARPAAASIPGKNIFGHIRLDAAALILLSMAGLGYLLKHRGSLFEGMV